MANDLLMYKGKSYKTALDALESVTYLNPNYIDAFVLKGEIRYITKEYKYAIKELNEANAKNDLQKVSEILANLEKGILSTSKGDKLTDKDKLRETVNRLRVKVKILETEIITIKQSETFKTIIL